MLVVDRDGVRLASEADFVGCIAEIIGDAGKYRQRLRPNAVRAGREQNRLRKADERGPAAPAACQGRASPGWARRRVCRDSGTAVSGLALAGRTGSADGAFGRLAAGPVWTAAGGPAWAAMARTGVGRRLGRLCAAMATKKINTIVSTSV